MPRTLVFEAAGGTQSFTITATCEWNISGLPPWLSASEISATDSRTVTLTATARTENGSREAILTIGRLELLVRQTAGQELRHGKSIPDSSIVRSYRDDDLDGLDDGFELQIAVQLFPRLWYFRGASASENCAAPFPRPILFRARPLKLQRNPRYTSIVVSYVLLYNEDCGAGPHPGDNEAFTTYVRLDEAGNWLVDGVFAVGHFNTAAETTSTDFRNYEGWWEPNIWVARNKHANYANLSGCDNFPIPGDHCGSGYEDRRYTFQNTGEPEKHLSDSVGDVLLKAGADPNYFSTPGNVYDPSAPVDAPQWLHALYQSVHSVQVWGSNNFMGGGAIRDGLFLKNSFVLPLLHYRPPYVDWDPD
jgi:hypothetical protein